MASAIGKLQAALAVATQETTFALFNLNFDFSLVKVDAPIEFHGLGAALSTKRRNASESGDHHRTARKLGSLFEQTLPDTPNLFKAYGLRVSEIAQSPAGTAKGAKSFGPFADYVGIDGTNIWAAATSGNSAIAVHLLACMLARIWKASEAIGLWEQIITARKQELSTFDETGSIHIQSLVTSQLTLTRDQISEWDASARAWLRTADEAKAVAQKQLMLIVENVNIPVNRNMDVYRSVMEAWKTAMVTMDKVIMGMGHSVREGSVLLGLAAWHIYPDMIVLGSSSTEIKQHDPLIGAGGVITIGLQRMNGESMEGVYWSLPLAYVRYYGDPVVTPASIGSDSSRVSMEYFLQVILGTLCRCWGVGGPQVKDCAKLIRYAWKCCRKGLEELPQSTSKERLMSIHWLKIMADAAVYFLKSKETEHEACRRLIALGQKRCDLLGKPSRYSTPIMGLRGDSYVSMIKHREAKVSFLREVSAKYDTAPDSLVIRIQVKLSENLKGYEYLTALPTPTSGHSSSQNNYEHKRWVIADSIDAAKSEWLRQNREVITELSEETVADDIEPLHDVSWFRWHNPPTFFADPPVSTDDVEPDDESEGSSLRGLSRWNPFSSSNSTTVSTQKHTVTFQPFYGDPETAAIFRRVDRPEIAIQETAIDLELLLSSFHADQINPQAFVRHLARIQPVVYEPVPRDGDFDPEPEVMACLKSVETAVMVFKQLPSATISLHVITHASLASTLWALASQMTVSDFGEASRIERDLWQLFPKSLSRAATFSCIAFFESGGFDIDPATLGSIMAISSGNSIFVATPLLCDPAEEPASHGVQRIIGNVGRSGIAFLYPPENPKTKEWDLGFYQVVRHEDFDGRLDNCFQSTTLHLAFTGYESPIDVGVHGGRFIEAFFLETVVSVHDRGEWVADLDVLSTFESPLFYSLIDQPACRDEVLIQVPDFSIVAIDSWKELIDRPLQVAVLRAHGNWLARLAAAALSVRLGIPTVIFGESCCWACGEKMLKQIQSNGVHRAQDGYNNSNSVVFIL